MGDPKPKNRLSLPSSSTNLRGTGVYSAQKRLRYDLTISFFDADMEGVRYLYDDVVMITAKIFGFNVRNITVDTHNIADVLFN